MIPTATRRTGMPAAHAILAVMVTVATVGVGNRFDLLDRDIGGGGDASSFDFEPTGASGAGTQTSDPVVPATTVPGALADVAPTTTPTLETTIAAVVDDGNREPTREDPLRLYIAGDSDAGNMGPPLQRELEKTNLVDSKLFYKPSSGLSVPSFFDWPSKLQQDVTAYNPDVVVVTFGGNDAQDIDINGNAAQVDSPEWKAEYGRRVGAVMDFLAADGRTLIWVGIPNAKSESFRARLQILEEVTRAEAAKRPGVVYVDVWNMFVGLSGGYADFIIDKRDGEGKSVRASDGFHLNVAGSEILALDVAEEVRKDMRERGAQV
jgi:uncharacterized protein